jgi:hypothetical protein
MSLVKTWRNRVRRAAVLVLAFGGSACATHQTGLVHPAAEGADLETMEGERYHLILVREATELAWLDGHVLEVWGRRIAHAITVTDWRVSEGLHGMPAWHGLLDERGVQVGLLDRSSGAYYLVDDLAADTLRPYVGLPVLVEGYIEGSHRIRVLYFRVLAEHEEIP